MIIRRICSVDNDLLDRVAQSSLGLTLLSFVSASLAGLANTLRNGGTLTLRYVVGAVLHSGVWGVLVAWSLSDYMPGHRFQLIAIAMMAGIGGATVGDFIVSTIRHGLGIKIEFKTDNTP